MKYLKRIAWFTAGTILVTKYIINHRDEKRKEREHKLILGQLKSNKDIIKIEDPEKTGIKFIKHPKSKKLSADGKIIWNVWASGVMMIQLDDNNLIIPSNPDKQFHYYFHERGHLENKNNGHFKKEKACGYNVYNCLRGELEAELNVIKESKKIGKKFEKTYWSKNFGFLWKQCGKCLKTINQEKCPKEEREKIKKYLKIIFQSVKSEEKK